VKFDVFERGNVLLSQLALLPGSTATNEFAVPGLLATGTERKAAILAYGQKLLFRFVWLYLAAWTSLILTLGPFVI
jgi:hypothetical protein